MTALGDTIPNNRCLKLKGLQQQQQKALFFNSVLLMCTVKTMYVPKITTVVRNTLKYLRR